MMKKFYQITMLFVFMTISIYVTVSAQQPQFGHLGVADGLSQGVVLCILQDSQGFMWFCTEDGLNKYDGYEFTVYKHEPDNPNSLSSSHVWAAYAEKDTHTLWVATSNGLDKLDLQTGQFGHYRHDEHDPHSLSSNDVRAIHEDRTGMLWIATWGGGLNAFDRETERFTRYQHDPDNPASLSNNHTLWGNSLYEDPTGTLWNGTGGGFNKFDRETGGFVSYQPDEHNPNSVNSEYVGTFASGKDPNVLWIGSAGGLNKFDPATETFVNYPEFEELIVADIFSDHAGNLWLCTDDGLYLFDEESETVLAHYPYDPNNTRGIASNDVNSMYQDHTDILWVATWGAGLNTLGHTKTFVSYQHRPNDPHSLSSARATNFTEDNDGNLWIGGGAGLDKLDRQTGTFTRYTHDPNDPRSLFSDRVTGLGKGLDGFLWLGTNEGLGKFDPHTETWVQYQHEPNNSNSLLNNSLEDPFMDSTGMLWISTWTFGTSRFDPKSETFAHYLHDPNNPQSISSNLVHIVYEDTHGTLWLGTDIGLDRFERETETFTHYQHDEHDPESLSRGNVYTIAEDADGFLWLGLLSGGLNKFDPATGTVRRYNQSNSGLPNDTVHCLVPDDQGSLWLATNDGVSKFDPDTDIVKNYTVGDGLPGNDFTYGACLKTSRGELVFGTMSNGFTLFHPADIQGSPSVFPVVFTDFQLFDKPIILDKDSPLMRHINFMEEITLSHEQDVFTLEFAALQYHNPEKHRYKYKMEGLDQDWIEVASNDRSVRYTNLDPGTYVFTVKARNHDGVWDEEGKSITIRIRPPWWHTWWAYTLYVLTAAGMILGYIRWRLSTTEAQKRHLEIQVAERTQELQVAKERALEAQRAAEVANQTKSTFLANMSHELRTPLNGVLGYAQVLKRDPAVTEHQQEGLDVIEQSGNHLLTLINDVLDLAKVESGTIELYQTNFSFIGFLRNVSELIRIRAERKGLSFRVEQSDELPDYVLGDERRLRQILLNLLGNAVKFTEQGTVTLKVTKVTKVTKVEGENHQSSIFQPVSGQASILQFSISDTGVGIAPEDMHTIFEPFQQTGDQQHRVQGTGLGLAITRNLTQLMGGELHVDSAPGRGSTFWFEIPLSLVTGEVRTAVRVSRRIIGIKGTPATLLIVDDNWENRAVLLNLLEPVGFKILEAHNGREGFSIATAYQPEAIITDLIMPDMDGFALIRQIRQSDMLKDTVVIATSASVYEEDRRKSADAGSDVFLSKPVDADRLLEQLQRLLHLEWRYQEPDEASEQAGESAEFILPPAETLKRLLDLTDMGDAEELQQYLRVLRESDEHYAPFVTQFCQLAADLQLNTISVLLERYLDT